MSWCRIYNRSRSWYFCWFFGFYWLQLRFRDFLWLRCYFRILNCFMWFDLFLFFFYYPLFSCILAAIQDVWCIKISIQSTLFWCFRLWFGDWWLFLALNWLLAFCFSDLYDLLCPRLQLHMDTLLLFSYLFKWFALRWGWQLNKFDSVRTRWF